MLQYVCMPLRNRTPRTHLETMESSLPVSSTLLQTFPGPIQVTRMHHNVMMPCRTHTGLISLQKPPTPKPFFRTLCSHELAVTCHKHMRSSNNMSSHPSHDHPTAVLPSQWAARGGGGGREAALDVAKGGDGGGGGGGSSSGQV